MAYGLINADQIGTSVANTSLGAGDASLMKNRIINGAMVIDQRNAGASVTPTSIYSQYTIDRWVYIFDVASKISIQQNAGSVTPPVGFTNYLGMTSLSAYAVAAGNILSIGQYIEGYNVADLAWGTANAKTVTLSFWAYSSLTGTFGGSVRNGANNRSYPFSYSIPVANTWTQISVTIPGDTSGTWATNNTSGPQITWGLGVGSTLSGAAGSWSSNNYISATGATNIAATNGATFYITGVQLEVGSIATGYEYRQYGQELALCQRYYSTSGGLYTTGQVSGYGTCYFSVNMRAAPTMVISNAFGVSGSQSVGSPIYTWGFVINNSSNAAVGFTSTNSAEL
jgi:hypothetical protein